ncbi:MAG: nitronate monooxygenase [Candidatus Hadarchaeales archaeon]
MIRTKLCELLGIKHPIIQGGMGPFQTNKLAVAVANAGALGIISTSGIVLKNDMGVDLGPLAPEKGDSYEVLKKIIHQTAKATEEERGIFGINVMVSAEMREPARKLIQAAIDAREENPEVRKRLRAIITSAGDPLPWTEVIKPSGVTWLHVVPSVRAARRCEKAGVDVIIASGHEGGGHTAWEPVHSMVLIPAVARAVKTPVVAAGGFADGASLVAALALGAVGVQMGTRFVATKEADFVQMWKERILKSEERDTIIARGFVGPLRYLKNKASIELAKQTLEKIPELFIGRPDITLDPDILARELEGTMALLGEDDEKALFYGGEVAGRISDIPSVKELIERIIGEAEEILRKMPEFLDKS